jgi:hypothetical protein
MGPTNLAKSGHTLEKVSQPHSGTVWEILCINSKSFHAAHIQV